MLTTGYILLLVLLIILLSTGVKAIYQITYPNTPSNKVTAKATIFMLIWSAYVLGISQTNILKQFTLPPRVPLLLVLPILLFIIYFLTRKKNQALIKAVPLHWTVYFQAFRIGVELLIYYTFVQGIFPITVTIEGRNFDALMGITAPIIGYFVSKNTKAARTVTLIWNFIGLFMLLNVVIIFNTSAYAPQLWGASTSLIKTDNMLPLALLAGVFMPTAVFMHLLSISAILKANRVK